MQDPSPNEPSNDLKKPKPLGNPKTTLTKHEKWHGVYTKRIWRGGKPIDKFQAFCQTYLGTYLSAHAAAYCVRQANLKLGRSVNSELGAWVPDLLPINQPYKQQKRRKTSLFPGVSFMASRTGRRPWRSSVRIEGKTLSGFYETEEEAVRGKLNSGGIVESEVIVSLPPHNPYVADHQQGMFTHGTVPVQIKWKNLQATFIGVTVGYVKDLLPSYALSPTAENPYRTVAQVDCNECPDEDFCPRCGGTGIVGIHRDTQWKAAFTKAAWLRGWRAKIDAEVVTLIKIEEGGPGWDVEE